MDAAALERWMEDALRGADEEYDEDGDDGIGRGSKKKKKRRGGVGTSSVAAFATSGRRSHAEASRAFIKRVLSWTIDGLRANTREAVGEGPMVDALTTYDSVDAFYATCEALAYEEARAVLSAAVLKRRDGTGGRFTLVVKSVGNVQRDGRRGRDVIMVEARRTGGGSSAAAGTSSKATVNEWRRPATALLLRRQTTDANDILAVVAASHEAANSEVVPLWMRERDVPNVTESTVFTAVALDSLISHSRMACACFMRPKVAFAHQILGHKPSSHTKFANSDSESDRDIEEEYATPVVSTIAVEENGDDASIRRLNPSQRRALHRFLTHNGHMDQLQMVQGPPGCGKTHFTVSLLHELSARRRRVLVCAPSNKAVCVAMELYLRTLPGHAKRFARCVLLGVEETLQEVSTKKTQGDGTNTDYDDEEEETSVMDFFIYSRAAAISNQLRRALDAANNQAKSQLSMDILAAAIDTARSQLMFSAPQFLMGDLRDAFSFLEKLVRLGDTTLSSEIYDKGVQLATAIASGSGRGERANEFAYEALNKAQIVFCTLSSAGQSIMALYDAPDVLLVDEAAQALEPEIVVPFLRNPSKCLLVGDPAQLPATLSSEIARKHGHATSLMERLMSVNDEKVSLLDTQYRMHPDISQWPRAYFYAQRLLNAADVCVRDAPLGLPAWLRPYTFVDVRGEERGSRGESKSNPREAEVAAAVIEKLTAHTSPLSVVVITFYSAQKRLITHALASKGLAGKVPVHSVDSFQGSEADVVVCSAVRSNSSGNVGFLSDQRRLNVALTRAKHALVILASVDTLKSTRDDALRALVHDAESRGAIIRERDIR
jgi:hypothetical protein